MDNDPEAKELIRQYYAGEITAGELEWALMTEADKIAICNLCQDL